MRDERKEKKGELNKVVKSKVVRIEQESQLEGEYGRVRQEKYG